MRKDLINAKVDLQVENLIIICNINDISTVFLMREVVEWILRNFHSITVYVQDIFEKSTQFAVGDLCKDSNCSKNRVKYWSKEFVKKHDSFFDLMITLGVMELSFLLHLYSRKMFRRLFHLPLDH